MLLKKLTLLLVICLCLTSAACADSYDINLTVEEKLWLKHHPHISIGIMSDWPPLNFTDNSGKPHGIGVAYIDAINKRLGGAVVIHPAPFKENYEKVRNGELDALMDITARPEREALFNFTRPYISIPHVIVGRRGGAYFNSEADLAGKTVALERGFYNVTHFRRRALNIVVREYGSTSEALDAVARGAADAYAGNRAVAIYLIEKELLGNLQPMGRLQQSRSLLQIGVAKNQPVLVSILDKALQSMTDDEQHAIYNKWVGLKYEKGMDYALFWKVAAVSVAVILLFLFWNRRMGKEIRIRKRAEEELTVYRDGLEKLVRERTAELQKEIDERIRSEQIAIVSQQRFRDIFDNIADPVYIADMSGKIIAANAQASRELGYSNEELLAFHVHDLDAVATSPELFAAQLGNLPESGGMAIESIHHRKDGSGFPVEINIRQINFDGQQSVLGVARNISERKQAEEDRHKLEQQLLHAQKLESLGVLAGGIAHDFNNILMAIIGNADLALMRISKESPAVENLHRIEKAAARAADLAKQMLGYSNEELLALNILDLDAVYATPELLSAHFVNLLESGEMFHEAIHRRKDGSQFPVELNVRLIDFGGQQSVLGVARNISERKQAEEDRHKLEQQLLHAQKLESLGVLAGGIAHDFNNILMAIIGNADLALMRISKESPAVENLHRIEKAAARAADLAKQMLAYSGKGKFVIENIDLNMLIEEMLHMLEVSVSKKAVLRINQHQPLPPVEADATQMRQVVMNLVINASEAIGDRSGFISITTGCMVCDRNYLKDVWLDENLSAGQYVYLEIADSGCGMDKDTLAKLFDPFFTTKFTGRGLGMAAVLGIVRGHRGAIKVYSEVDKGTAFKILLPASGKTADISHGEAPADGWLGSGTVLLVDDEETVRGVGAEMLQEFGFATLTANNGREAVEIFSSTPDIAFVILDLTMPHMDGEQCFRELRRLDPDVKVILSSGYSEHEVTRKFVGKGLAGFIQKPYTLSVLKEAIRGL